jgi:hypothetical protein
MTILKSAILASALGLSSLTFASAATYDVVLTQPATVGSTKLAPGSYKINIDGGIATFRNVKTNESVILLVRKGVGNKTFERTVLQLKEENGTERLHSMELEDSASTVEFN